MPVKSLSLSALALCLAGAPLFAQTATPTAPTAPTTAAPVAPSAAPPAATMAPPADSTAATVDCSAEFATLDTDKNGRLSETEAPSAWARARIDGPVPDAEGMTPEAYAALCGASHWQTHTTDEGAPLEGANSFTENQARDRALSWDFTEISELVKDDKGIWRGTAKRGTEAVNLAIDYKGNVVATAAN